MSSKLNVLVVDVGGCEGCVVSIFRALPQLAAIANIYSKYTGGSNLVKHYDVSFITGSACINDAKVIGKLKTIRDMSDIVVAYGSCASVGGITRFCRGGQEPKPEHRVYQPLSHIINVDYAIPGCPPAPALVVSFLNNLKHGGGYFLQLFAAVARVRKLSGFDLLDDVVLSGLCVGCGACVLSCPTGALHIVEGRPDLIVEKCIRCGTCYVRCPRASQLLIRRYAPEVKKISSGDVR